MPSDPGTRRARLGANLLAALLFLALAVVTTRPIAGDLFGQTVNFPDALIDLWTVNWLTNHFFEPSQIFQGNIYAPFAHSVLFSDLSLGTVVLLLPLRPFVHDPMRIYNLAL